MILKKLLSIIAIILIMIIKRWEANYLRKLKKWILIYGRRKTGKSFLVGNFLNYDEYFFVKRDRNIFEEKSKRTISYNTLVELVARDLEEGKTVVIDEFHRLGEEFLDFLHLMSGKKGKLILITSTLHLAKNILSKNSALLGSVAEFELELIRLDDVIKSLTRSSLCKTISKKDILEMAIIMQEPMTVDYFDETKKPREMLSEIVTTTRFTIPALVGEIFTEEEKSLSKIYEGILRSVSIGKQISSEISSYLYSNKLIKKDDPSLIQPYLMNLVNLGIIRRVKVVNKRTYRYFLVSPLMEIFYYSDEKYNFSEFSVDNKFVFSVLNEIFPKIVEQHVRWYISRRLNLIEGIIEENNYDIAGYLMKFKKGEIAIEIKWKDKISEKDVKNGEKILSKVDAKRKILFIPDKSEVNFTTDIEIWDVEDLTKMNLKSCMRRDNV